MWNYKKVVVAGCSFTYNNEMTWAGKLAEHTDIVNVGSGAAGNDYIARSIINEAERHSNPVLICQWSGIHRKSYYIDSSHPLHSEFRKSEWPDWAGDYTDINSDAVKKPDFWIKTGGNNITHKGSSDLIHEQFVKPYAKYFYSDEQALVESLENILKVQYYCKSKGLKNIMFWWKPEIENYKLGRFSGPLASQITNEHTIWLPSIGEWCVENTDLTQEQLNQGFHPTKAQHDQYAEKVIIPNVS